MKKQIKQGLIIGILGFFLIVLPMIKFMEWMAKESIKPKKQQVIYFKELGKLNTSKDAICAGVN